MHFKACKEGEKNAVHFVCAVGELAPRATVHTPLLLDNLKTTETIGCQLAEFVKQVLPYTKNVGNGDINFNMLCIK